MAAAARDGVRAHRPRRHHRARRVHGRARARERRRGPAGGPGPPPAPRLRDSSRRSSARTASRRPWLFRATESDLPRGLPLARARRARLGRAPLRPRRGDAAAADHAHGRDAPRPEPRRRADARRGSASRVGTLYAINTWGAVAGTAATGFVLLPAVGLRVTVWLGVALNLLVAGLALALDRSGRARRGGPLERREPVRAGGRSSSRRRRRNAGESRDRPRRPSRSPVPPRWPTRSRGRARSAWRSAARRMASRRCWSRSSSGWRSGRCWCRGGCATGGGRSPRFGLVEAAIAVVAVADTCRSSGASPRRSCSSSGRPA